MAMYMLVNVSMKCIRCSFNEVAQVLRSRRCLSYSSWSYHLQPDLGKQDSHHFECHLVSWLPQVLLLHCVPLHPRWLHHCHPTCRQWHLPHSDLPPTRHHLQDWGGGCEEGRRSRRTEGKRHGELHYRWGALIHVCMYLCSHFRVFSPDYRLHSAITHVIRVLERWSLMWIPMV